MDTPINTKFYTNPLAYGICAKVDPYSTQATDILNEIEPYIDKCSMPDCSSEAVRVGLFDCEGNSEFRGLCEIHKQFGMWEGAWTH